MYNKTFLQHLRPRHSRAKSAALKHFCRVLGYPSVNRCNLEAGALASGLAPPAKNPVGARAPGPLVRL